MPAKRSIRARAKGPSAVTRERLTRAAAAIQTIREAATEFPQDPRLVAALQLLLAAVFVSDQLTQTVRPNSNLCPNCDSATDEKRIFCTELCSQEAGLVRYLRRVLLDDRVRDIAVLRDGIGTNLLMVRGGGYPDRARQVTPDIRSKVTERDAGKCTICGAKGTEIDHIKGSSNELTNLRLTCRNCNGNLMTENVVTATDPSEIAALRDIDTRLGQRAIADSPLRVCDDDIRWRTAWRSFKHAYRK